MKTGDFTYNGIPIFKVGMNDFSLLVESFQDNRRIYMKSILNESLRDYYKNSRDVNFGISYEGVIVDFRRYSRR